jgi:hypothetical protein
MRQDAQRIIRWSRRNNVPILITEIGCVQFYDGITDGPPTPEDCPKFAAEIKRSYLDEGVGIVWSRLEDVRSIYVREAPKDQEGIPPSRVPNWLFLRSLGLPSN